ncbi:MAG: hypothetical protein WCO98_06985 [bacterium]
MDLNENPKKFNDAVFMQIIPSSVFLILAIIAFVQDNRSSRIISSIIILYCLLCLLAGIGLIYRNYISWWFSILSLAVPLLLEIIYFFSVLFSGSCVPQATLLMSAQILVFFIINYFYNKSIFDDLTNPEVKALFKKSTTDIAG